MAVDPAQIDQLSRLGIVGILLLVIGVLGYLVIQRKIITMGEKRDSDAIWDARMKELREDRDEWREIGKAAVSKLDRLTDVLASVTGHRPD